MIVSIMKDDKVIENVQVKGNCIDEIIGILDEYNTMEEE